MGVIFEAAGYQLTDIEMGDAPEIFERLTSKPAVMRYLPIKVHGTMQETFELIAYYRQLVAAGGIRIAVIRHGGNRIIGTLGMAGTGHAIALALKIAPDRFSMGAGRTLAPQVIHWLLSHDGCKRVWAYTDVDNKGVANLLRKINVHCEGTMRKYAIHPNISSEPRDCHLWSMVR
jgi:ribosomal-protein-alanine N-acetyltransferase